MSTASITIDLVNEFRVIETKNYDRDDIPVDEATAIAIFLGEDLTIRLTIGQWRALSAAVEAGIDEIPAERERWREMRQRHDARADAVSA